MYIYIYVYLYVNWGMLSYQPAIPRGGASYQPTLTLLGARRVWYRTVPRTVFNGTVRYRTVPYCGVRYRTVPHGMNTWSMLHAIWGHSAISTMSNPTFFSGEDIVARR